MIAFKLVKRDLNDQNVFHSYTAGSSRVSYEIGKETKRNSIHHGPLACFKSLKQAIRYITADCCDLVDWKYFTILLCEITPAKENIV